MPEGDTIFRAATSLRRALEGARVVTWRSERLGRGPVGERIEKVEAEGKNLLIRFEKGRTLRTHMMMHGSWHLYREGEKWRMPGHFARVEIHADSGWVAVCFSAPVVEWLKAPLQLGPDAATDGFDEQQALQNVKALQKEMIERALLTQYAIAGVGNVIKCEALFICRENPFTRVEQLDDARLAKLIRKGHELLLANRVHGPRTTRKAMGGSRYWVYRRIRQPCFVCGEAILSRRTARITYFCPHCQAAR
jgi:endonuclease-8